MSVKNCNNVDVSVIVPLFHGAKYISNLLQMVGKNIESARQINVELVLVNDSPDDVPDYSEARNANFAVVFVCNEENLGIQRARLRGVEHSHGKYLLFLDQDDMISDDAIWKLYNSVQDADIAVSDWFLERPSKHGIVAIEMLAKIEQYSLNRFSYCGNIIGPPCHCLIKRDSLPSCWRNRIMKINGADDYYMWMGMLAEKRKFVHCDGKLYIHKYHDNCFSNAELIMLKSEDEAFKLAADEYDIAPFWRWIHIRNIRERIRSYEIKQKNGSMIKRRALMILYPEQLLLRTMEKCGIYV